MGFSCRMLGFARRIVRRASNRKYHLALISIARRYCLAMRQRYRTDWVRAFPIARRPSCDPVRRFALVGGRLRKISSADAGACHELVVTSRRRPPETGFPALPRHGG